MNLRECFKRVRSFLFGNSIFARANRRTHYRRLRYHRPTLELLEDRTLLDANIDTNALAAPIMYAIADLDQFAQSQVNQALSQPLATLAQPLTSVMNLRYDPQQIWGGTLIHADLEAPAAIYLFGTDDPFQHPGDVPLGGRTVDGLAAALTSITPGNIVNVTASFDANGGPTYHVTMDVTKQDPNAAMAPGGRAAALGINTNATVDLSVELKTSFQFTPGVNNVTGTNEYWTFNTQPSQYEFSCCKSCNNRAVE